jgi:hypothetical protein
LSRKPLGITALAGAVALWIVLACAGAWAMVRYESTPGPKQTAPSRWPRESTFTRAADRTTLLVFMHPLCSCSEATLAELEQLVASNGREFRSLAVFAIPELGDAAWGAGTGTQTAWKDSPVVRHAQSIDGVSVIFDPGGIETRRFGAVTSGFVAVYGAVGRAAG